MRTQASRAISELLEDDDFQQLITDRLEEDPTFWTGSGKRRTVITVEVDDGHVTLNGVVRTRMAVSGRGRVTVSQRCQNHYGR